MRRPPDPRGSAFPPPARKRPPPEHGIKVRRAGATWWGARWIAALERLSAGYAGRLSRGKSYARAGRVHDLAIGAGRTSARVTGTRDDPYAVEILLPVLADATWRGAIAQLASEARFAAQLLAGEMPDDVDDAFRAAGATLFPARADELTTTCSCPDWANPCKHVSATLYVLGDAFDRDPFLLFELRGRDRAEVLSALRAARRPPPRAPKRRTRGAQPARIDPARYDAWRAAPPEASFASPGMGEGPPAALLRQLGAPPSWHAADPPWKLLAPLVREASARARALATNDDDAGGAR